MRNFINKYGYVVAAAVILVAVVAVFLNTRKKPAPLPYAGNPELAFFVDEITGDESVLSADEIPPLPGKDGKDSLMIAVKFKSDTEKEPKTWYLVKYPTDVRDKARSLPKDSLDRMNMLESSRLVRSPESGSPWVPQYGADAEKIVTVPESSPGHPRQPVFPAKP